MYSTCTDQQAGTSKNIQFFEGLGCNYISVMQNRFSKNILRCMYIINLANICIQYTYIYLKYIFNEYSAFGYYDYIIMNLCQKLLILAIKSFCNNLTFFSANIYLQIYCIPLEAQQQTFICNFFYVPSLKTPGFYFASPLVHFYSSFSLPAFTHSTTTTTDAQPVISPTRAWVK